MLIWSCLTISLFYIMINGDSAKCLASGESEPLTMEIRLVAIGGHVREAKSQPHAGKSRDLARIVSVVLVHSLAVLQSCDERAQPTRLCDVEAWRLKRNGPLSGAVDS